MVRSRRRNSQSKSGVPEMRSGRTDLVYRVPCSVCVKAGDDCRYKTTGKAASCVRCQEKKTGCTGGTPPDGVRTLKRKSKTVVDSDIEELETPPPPTKKIKKTEETPKAGPSKGKERAHPQPEPEPEVEKIEPKKTREDSLDTRDLFLRVLHEMSGCRSEMRRLHQEVGTLRKEMTAVRSNNEDLRDEMRHLRMEMMMVRQAVRTLDDVRDRTTVLEAYLGPFMQGQRRDHEGLLKVPGVDADPDYEPEAEMSGEGSKEGEEGEGTGESSEGSDGQKSGKEPEEADEGSGKGPEGSGKGPEGPGKGPEGQGPKN